MQGYIKIHRKMMDSAIWQDPNYLKLWMYCLLKASHKPREILVGNKALQLDQGQFVTGRKALAEDLNKGVKPDQQLSEKSWSRYLKNLEKWKMLSIKPTNKFSVITVVNYSIYQHRDNRTDHQKDQQLTSNCPTTDQQLTTNKNVKNVKNVNTTRHKFEICDMENAKLLFQLMLENNPSAKRPNFEKWANDFRLIRERDNKTDHQIKWLINWTQQHDFWSSNILSPSKLRKQWDQLVVKATKEYQQRSQKVVAIGAGKKPNAEDFNLND